MEHKYIEHHPPDTAACIFWLKNRHSKLWRERPYESGVAEDDAMKEMLAAMRNSPVVEDLSDEPTIPGGSGGLVQ
jgi:hypothetical protein